MQMNPELHMVLMPAYCWFLFSLGGTQITKDNKIKGQKWIRRFLLPALISIHCLFVVAWWQALLVGGVAMIAFCMGYGTKHSDLERFIVACMYGVISLPIGLSVWNAICVAIFLLFFFASNTKYLSKVFTWKLCEGMFGFSVGVSISYLLAGNGIIW